MLVLVDIDSLCGSWLCIQQRNIFNMVINGGKLMTHDIPNSDLRLRNDNDLNLLAHCRSLHHSDRFTLVFSQNKSSTNSPRNHHNRSWSATASAKKASKPDEPTWESRPPLTLARLSALLTGPGPSRKVWGWSGWSMAWEPLRVAKSCTYDRSYT